MPCCAAGQGTALAPFPELHTRLWQNVCTFYFRQHKLTHRQDLQVGLLHWRQKNGRGRKPAGRGEGGAVGAPAVVAQPLKMLAIVC